jgi:hypothetical protein
VRLRQHRGLQQGMSGLDISYPLVPPWPFFSSSSKACSKAPSHLPLPRASLVLLVLAILILCHHSSPGVCFPSQTQRIAKAPPPANDITISNSNQGFCRLSCKSTQGGQSRVVFTPKCSPEHCNGVSLSGSHSLPPLPLSLL